MKSAPKSLLALFILLCLVYIIARPKKDLIESIDFSRMVKDRQGDVLRITLSPDEKFRVYTDLDAFHPRLKDAVLMKEDRYFRWHPGFNPVSLIRAFYLSYVQGDKKIGGSTINMQLARLYYKLNTRTIIGKIKQIFLAVYIEAFYSKDEIFAAYLNLVPCGGNIEGYSAAAFIYFEKDTRELTLQEILFLALLPQNPGLHRPGSATVHKNLLEGSERLLALWKSVDASEDLNGVALSMPLKPGYHKPFKAPHYSEMLLQKYPDMNLITGSLDMTLQNTVSRLASRYIDRKKSSGVYNTAVLIADSKTMQVRALLGSADYFNSEIEGQVNGATARRSPGSTLKPFIYALAMEQGIIHPMTMLKDAPTSFSEYSPDNYQSDYKGPIKAWDALVSSRNVPAVYLASKIKSPDLYDFLTATGARLKPKDHYGLSLVLGGAEFTMYQLLEFYGILANQGYYQPLQNGIDPMESSNRPGYRALSEPVSFLVKEILAKNPRPDETQATGAKVSSSPVAYKTGTSIGFKDCWSVGIFDDYLIAVWLGNFNGYGNPEFNGRYLAAPLMFEIIDAVRANGPPLTVVPWEVPDGITEVKVCRVSGQMARPHCAKQIDTRFIPGVSPIHKCSVCRLITVNKKSGYRLLNRNDPRGKTEVYEFWPTDLLQLFRKTGIPRRTPPPFDPRDKVNLLEMEGEAPEMVSPLAKTEYILRQGDSVYNDLPLIATTDADVREVYWFLDNDFIGTSEPGATAYWDLKPGAFQISVVDDHGRGHSRDLKIIYSQ